MLHKTFRVYTVKCMRPAPTLILLRIQKVRAPRNSPNTEEQSPSLKLWNGLDIWDITIKQLRYNNAITSVHCWEYLLPRMCY